MGCVQELVGTFEEEDMKKLRISMIGVTAAAALAAVTMVTAPAKWIHSGGTSWDSHKPSVGIHS